MFLKALGVDKIYGAGSQDTNARFVADVALYGSPLTLDVPDVNNADVMLIFGANPLISHGSLIFLPRARHQLDAVHARGRVVVVDPRRTETAAAYEHVAIQPNSDCWLMLAMLRVIVEDGLAAEDYLAAHATGWAELRAAAMRVDMADVERRTGIAASKIRDLAHMLATTERAVCYGRVGICRGPHATLANFLLSALNIVSAASARSAAATSRPRCWRAATGRRPAAMTRRARALAIFPASPSSWRRR